LPYTQDVAGSNPAPPNPSRLETPESCAQIIPMSFTSADDQAGVPDIRDGNLHKGGRMLAFAQTMA